MIVYLKRIDNVKVKCIKKDENDEITIGSIYECLGFGMTDLDCGMLRILDDEGDVSYLAQSEDEPNGYLYSGDKFEIYEAPDGELKKFYEKFIKLPEGIPQPIEINKTIIKIPDEVVKKMKSVNNEEVNKFLQKINPDSLTEDELHELYELAGETEAHYVNENADVQSDECRIFADLLDYLANKYYKYLF